MRGRDQEPCMDDESYRKLSWHPTFSGVTLEEQRRQSKRGWYAESLSVYASIGHDGTHLGGVGDTLPDTGPWPHGRLDLGWES